MTGPFHQNPVGTGPFLLKELVMGDHATLVRNPNYWRKPLPYLDGARLVFVNSSVTEANMLISGQTDVMLFTYSGQLKTLAHSSKINLLTAHSASYSPIHMRSDQAPFSDNRVREAFKYVVDREQMVKIALQGYGDPGNDHMVAPVYPEYSSNGLRKQDYAKAKALLAAAGYPNGLTIDFYGVGSASSPDPAMVVFSRWLPPQASRSNYDRSPRRPIMSIGRRSRLARSGG